MIASSEGKREVKTSIMLWAILPNPLVVSKKIMTFAYEIRWKRALDQNYRPQWDQQFYSWQFFV